MPRLEINYANTIIYKIVCNDLTITDCYVGHTTDFTKRKNGHKGCCNNPNNDKHNRKVYEFIRANCGWENWRMIMLEEYKECENKLQACQRERYWIENLKASLNCQLPSRTQNEYKEDNREILAEYLKQYNLDNREILAEQKKQYNLKNKQQISEQKKKYQIDNKEQIAEYGKNHRLVNKEKISEQKKKYQIDNKEKIAEQKKKYQIDNKEKISEQKKQYYLKKKLENQGL